MADKDDTNPGETESTLNDEGAKYVGPPIRVRETKGDKVREYTTTYIKGDEDVELLPDVSAITEAGEFIEDVEYDADDLAVDNRSWSEIPQPRLAEGSAGGQAGPGLQPSEVEEQRRLAEEQNNPENVNLGAGVPQPSGESKSTQEKPQPAKRAQPEGEKGKQE